MSVKQISSSEAETMKLASQLALRLKAGDIIALHGQLGAGKTCFVRGLARGLGLDAAAVSSPTYIICQEYERNDHLRLAHIDAYRLSGPDDLESIGWDELIESADTILAIEWPERIDTAIPPGSRIDVSIRHVGENQREITIYETHNNKPLAA